MTFRPSETGTLKLKLKLHENDHPIDTSIRLNFRTKDTASLDSRNCEDFRNTIISIQDVDVEKLFPKSGDPAGNDQDKKELLHLSIDVQRYLLPKRPLDLALLVDRMDFAERFASGHVMELFLKGP